MEVSVIKREPMIVVGWKRKFISILASEEGSSNAIGDLWMNVFKHDEVSKLPGSLGHPTWGVIWADSPETRSHPAELNYLAGVPFSSVPELPEGLASYSVPGGTFAKITHKGPVSGLKGTIEAIHKWVDDNGYTEPANWCDLELYDERFFKQGPEQELDYFINIVPMIAQQPPNVTIEQAPPKSSEDTGSRSHEFKKRTDQLRAGKQTAKPSPSRKAAAKPTKSTKPKKAPTKKKAGSQKASVGKARKKPARKTATKRAKRPAKKAAKKPARKPAKKSARKPAKKPSKRR